MRRSFVLAALVLVVPAALAGQGPGRGGFAPDSLRNIRALPSTMTPIEVVGFMRNVTGALGVRCTFCHVGEEGRPLTTYDFASDDKPTKREAREMIRMVQAINAQFISQLPERQAPPFEVTCETCHRGVAVPRSLVDILGLAAQAGGADSAARAYRALRELYYGRAAYDFGEATLGIVSQRLVRGQRLDDALVVARLNAEFYPQSSQVQTNIGEVLRVRGDTTGAIAAYRQALQLNPQDGGARQRLRELGQQP